MAGRPQNFGFRRRLSRGSSTSESASILPTVHEVPAEHAVARKPHPPNRKQHEQDLKDITDKITAKEKEIANRKQQHANFTETSIARKSAVLQEIRDADQKLKMAIDALKERYDELAKKNDEINSLRPKITYQNEKQIDTIIHNLDHQRTTRHFSLPEEQKIIREIDRLRRSKNELLKFKKLVEEKNVLNTSVADLRAARQTCMNSVNELRKEKREIEDVERTHQDTVGFLSREINDLTQRKAFIIREYNRNSAEWDAHVTSLRKQKLAEKEQMRSVHQAQDWHEPVIRDPYAGLKQLVCSLLAYLQSFKQDDQQSCYSGSVPPLRPVTPPSVQIDLDDTSQPGYFLPRKHDAGIPFKSVGKTKKDKKKSKSIAHSAPVVAQFVQLDLLPPSTTAEVPDVIEQLKTKKEEYDKLSALLAVSKTPKNSPSEETPPPFPKSGSSEPSPVIEQRERIPSITVTDSEHAEKLVDGMCNLAVDGGDNSDTKLEQSITQPDSGSSFEIEVKKSLQDEAFDGADATSEITNNTSARSSVMCGDDFSERTSESSRDDDFQHNSPDITLTRPDFQSASVRLNINVKSQKEDYIPVNSGGDEVDHGGNSDSEVLKFPDGVFPETPPIDEYFKPPSYIIKGKLD